MSEEYNPAILYPPELDPAERDWRKLLPFGVEIAHQFGSYEIAWRRNPLKPMEWSRPDWRMRWTPPWVRHSIGREYLRADGSWVRLLNRDPKILGVRPNDDEAAWVREVPITVQVNGRSQQSVMSVYVERWLTAPHFYSKRKILKRIKVSQPSLLLEFSPSVGRGKGSWKGGVCGTTTAIINGESYEAAICRYVLSRPFDSPRPTLDTLHTYFVREPAE